MQDFIFIVEFIGKGIFTSFWICLAKYLLYFMQADFCARERFLHRIYTRQQQAEH